MRVTLYKALLGVPLLALLACNGGGDSTAPMIVTGPASTPSATTAVFDPANGAVPLPNVLVTASIPGPNPTYTAVHTPVAGTLNISPGYPLTPDLALAYVNLKEMGNTHAVSGVNAPIYIGFTSDVDATTVNGANIKVFQVVPDVPANPSSTENNPVSFVDISGLFTYSSFALLPAGTGTGVYAMPKLPLLPGSRYLYVVTNRVLDLGGKPVSDSPFFDALKSTIPLVGAFAALEPIRADAMVTGSPANIQLRGYAKIMDDLIAASATTTVTKRGDITLMGRFITTGAGYIPTDPLNATPALAAVRIPVETALWAYANNAAAAPLHVDFSTGESRAWTNGVANFVPFATTPGAVTAIFGAIPSAAVGYLGAGTFESADFQLDPYTVNANLANAGGKLDAVAGLVYNPGTSVVPGTGVMQAFRNGTGVLRGFYHRTRTVPFIIIAPITAAPVGGYPVAVFMHGIGGSKEQALGLANTLCAAGYAIVAIDQAVHGLDAGAAGSLTAPGLAGAGKGMGNGRPAAEWASNFFMLPSILTARTNVQTSAFNLWRLERILKQPTADPTSLQAAMVTAGKTVSPAGASQYVGQSLGSIVGAYFLAGNSNQTGGGNMKGLLSVPGGRIGFILKDSPSFAATVNQGLLAAGVATGSGAYYQFFALAQAVADPIDPATMGTPLSGAPTSRFTNRLLVQEAVGDTVIPNANGQYFVNAFAGRQGQLGADTSGGFTQILRNGQAAPAVPYVYGATLAVFKAPVAAALLSSASTPVQGVMQYSPAQHGMLLQDTATPVNVANCQTQMYAWVKYGLVADGANAAGFPIVVAPGKLEGMTIPGLFGPESLTIHFPLTPQE
ncbi:MAG TPA: hypothetical protein VF378_13705 [Geothrix sp.]